MSRSLIPNSTQTPDVIFDDWLPLLTANEAKIVFFIVRKTFGWGKLHERLGASDITQGTNLARSTVFAVCSSLEAAGVLTIKHGERGGNMNDYSLNTEDAEVVTSNLQARQCKSQSEVRTRPEGGLDRNADYTHERTRPKCGLDRSADYTHERTRPERGLGVDRSAVYPHKKQRETERPPLSPSGRPPLGAATELGEILSDAETLFDETPPDETPLLEVRQQPQVSTKEQSEAQEQSQAEEQPPKRKRRADGVYLNPPTLEEVVAEFEGKGKSFEMAEEFHAHHTTAGWRLPGNRDMVSWRSAVVTWIHRERKYDKPGRYTPDASGGAPSTSGPAAKTDPRTEARRAGLNAVYLALAAEQQKEIQVLAEEQAQTDRTACDLFRLGQTAARKSRVKVLSAEILVTKYLPRFDPEFVREYFPSIATGKQLLAPDLDQGKRLASKSEMASEKASERASVPA